jgi:Tfp pilus assembly protein PilZ
LSEISGLPRIAQIWIAKVLWMSRPNGIGLAIWRGQKWGMAWAKIVQQLGKTFGQKRTGVKAKKMLENV